MKIYSTLFTLFLLRLYLAYLFLPPVIHFCLHITFTRSKKILLRWSKEHRLHFLMRYRILSFFIFSCLSNGNIVTRKTVVYSFYFKILKKNLMIQEYFEMLNICSILFYHVMLSFFSQLTSKMSNFQPK